MNTRLRGARKTKPARPFALGENADEIVIFNTCCILPQFEVEVTLRCQRQGATWSKVVAYHTRILRDLFAKRRDGPTSVGQQAERRRHFPQLDHSQSRSNSVHCAASGTMSARIEQHEHGRQARTCQFPTTCMEAKVSAGHEKYIKAVFLKDVDCGLASSSETNK